MTDMSTNSRPKLRKAKVVTDNLELTANIPDASYAKKHITRDLNAGKSEYEIFDYAMANKCNVLIEGPSGAGKTNASIAYASKKQIPFYSVASNAGVDPSQLFGRYIPDEVNGGFEWVDGAVTSIVRHGGVLLLNEINFMPERISTVLFSLLDSRRSITLMDHKSETIKAHDDVLIIADMNPGYEGTRPLNKAFRNRFSIQMVWDYDPKVENKLVGSKTLMKIAKDIRAQAVNGEYTTPMGTNMLIEFEQIATGLGYDFAVQNIANHFTDTERDSVTKMFSSKHTAIKTELGIIKPVQDDDDLPIESKYPINHPIWDKRKAMMAGEMDDELGIKGVDWDLS